MTLDLKNSKQQLEEANEELIRSNIEIEQRRLYMEIVLANVGAGVVSADMDGRILTVNKSAEKMLDIRGEDIIGKDYKDVMGHEQVKVINDFGNMMYIRGCIRHQDRVRSGIGGHMQAR